MTIADRSRIGISSPHIFPEGKVDMDLVRRYVRRAEELGYASLWTQERVTGNPTVLHPTTFLAYVAGQTTTARIGVSVYVLPRHNPIFLAKAMADIDQMSGGRLIVGLGLGGSPAELPMYGSSPERRVRRFTEQVQALKALWTQTPATFQGEIVSFKDVNIEPKPVQRPHPPLWFGAHVEPALRRAVRHADGWTGAGSGGRESFEQALVRMDTLLVEAGRDRKSFSISKRIYLAVDNDEARALRRLKEWFGYYYGNADLADRVALWGSAAKVQDVLGRWSEAGVDEFVLNPVFEMEEHLEQLAELTGLS